MPDSQFRVLHYLEAVRLEEGGVVRCVLDLCGQLAKGPHDITLATFDTTDVPAAWKAGQPGTPRVIDLAGKPRDIARAIRQSQVVHLHTPWDTRNPGLARICRREGIPYIVSAHGMLDDYCMEVKSLKKRIYLTVAGRRLLEQAYRVHCTAEGEARQAEKWYPRGTSVVLPLVVDLPEPGTLPGPDLARETFPVLAADVVKLLFLSRVHPKKGIDTLLQSARQVLDSGIDLQLLIAGPGEAKYVDELKRLAAELQLADRTHFLGMVKGDTKHSLYQACDLFVLPTHQENFGIVLPESLVCGTPVVTTRGVDIWPEIEQAGGVIVEDDPQALAEQLQSLLADRDALAERGLRGREFVLDWLDPHRVAERYEQLYLEAARAAV